VNPPEPEENEPVSAASEGGDRQLGGYIRELRVKRNMSLRSLAGAAEVSVSFLSQVERGTASPSIASLMRIAKALDQTISSLFVERESSRLVRAGEGPRLVHPQREWEEELVSPREFSRLQIIRSTLAPGGSSGAELLSYGGASETSMIVESGSVSTTLGSEQFELFPGDCLSFDASTPHRIVNTGSVPSVIIFASSPPSY
jgi:XRE family transcriptional regulator, regulator of sulfur utilization